MHKEAYEDQVNRARIILRTYALALEKEFSVRVLAHALDDVAEEIHARAHPDAVETVAHGPHFSSWRAPAIRILIGVLLLSLYLWWAK
jgi:hypothetical protein